MKCDQNNGGGWRSLASLACLLTTQLANKPQPSLGHAASLCDHLCSVSFYWLQFLWQFLCSILWKVCCKAIQPYSTVLGVLFGIETMVHRGMRKIMQWITHLKDKRRHIGCFGILSLLSTPPVAYLIFVEQLFLMEERSRLRSRLSADILHYGGKCVLFLFGELVAHFRCGKIESQFWLRT